MRLFGQSGHAGTIVFNSKGWEVEEVIELSKTRMAIWIKRKFGVKNYSVDDFKRCLDGIRKNQNLTAGVWDCLGGGVWKYTLLV